MSSIFLGGLSAGLSTESGSSLGSVVIGGEDDHHQHEYNWPTLFEEADEMLQASLLMYLFSKLRMLARDKTSLLLNSNELLNLPIGAIRAYELIEINSDILKEQVGDEDVALVQGALKSMHERYVKMREKEEKSKTLIDMFSNSIEMIRGGGTTDADNQQPPPTPTTLVAFSDEKCDVELVYAVAVDSGRKRITVAFRGSVTPKDFVTDICIHMKQLVNPLSKFSGQDKYVKIHNGFYDYLLTNECKGKGVHGSKLNKYQEIMSHVFPLLNKHRRYKLYVTGHSLGGALATLFAFEVATAPDEIYPLPITCVSVASPKVGDESFRKAFQLLEEQGKLRHLRIANDLDPVPLSPPVSSSTMLTAMSPLAMVISSFITKSKRHMEIYKHVGIRLNFFYEVDKNINNKKNNNMNKNETDGNNNNSNNYSKVLKYHLSYSTGEWKQDIFHPASMAFVSNHYGNEYSTRLLKLKGPLNGMYLNDLYKQKDYLKRVGVAPPATAV